VLAEGADVAQSVMGEPRMFRRRGEQLLGFTVIEQTHTAAPPGQRWEVMQIVASALVVQAPSNGIDQIQRYVATNEIRFRPTSCGHRCPPSVSGSLTV
jgi:hypothetical protein